MQPAGNYKTIKQLHIKYIPTYPKRKSRISRILNSGFQQSQNGVKQSHEDVANKYGWNFDKQLIEQNKKSDRQILHLPLKAIRRPMQKTRSYDQEKIRALMVSIKEIGLQEPIEVLEVEGKFYGFSGCHRFEAHEKLGMETIKCRVRKANQKILKMHMM
eukprot:TRINITY_DN16947_c0_g1_i1.p2 TRINITY_DN16947_c0_g1~~TRINITY_DN16947_c0_g1_i1.p2  ORF type:complete len:159 (-),score=10.25 TRINITY_DN16947_c0_g1_i1:348-824(-)